MHSQDENDLLKHEVAIPLRLEPGRLNRAGELEVSPKSMSQATIQPLSVRLFPKHLGAQAYNVTGIARRCDWVLLTDAGDSTVYLHRNHGTEAPRHIFLSLRSSFLGIAYFYHEVLPLLRQPFVLISGSEDVTIPRQVDRRWRGFNESERLMIEEIISHPLLHHWYAENLSEDHHPRVSPLPTGLVFPEGDGERAVATPLVPTLQRRPCSMLCGHRHREGPQWISRSETSAFADSGWRTFTQHLKEEISEADYSGLLSRHSFVLCVEGGGLDPSPKAWQAILHGAIPVMRATALRRAYSLLPVVMLPEWKQEAITTDRLARWKTLLQPFYDVPSNRQMVLHRLSLDYWWQFIESRTAVMASTENARLALDA